MLLCNNNNIPRLTQGYGYRNSSELFKCKRLLNCVQLYVLIIIKWEIGFESYSFKYKVM